MKKVTAILFIITTVMLSAETTPLINYQGRLLKLNGQPVDNGYIDITVKLFDAENFGTKTYEEEIGSIPVVDSLYSFNFGTNSAAFINALNADECWIQLVINGLDMIPRKRLVSVPYSFRSIMTDNVTIATDETSVGLNAYGADSGTAVGENADGSYGGVSVGYDAYGIASGVAVGNASFGNDFGTAVGYAASAQFEGVALGYNATADFYKIALGASAEATGENSIAIGYNTFNNIDNSIRLRGMLYLDGGNNVYTRDTFGSGDWTPLISGFTGIVTNYNGSTTQLLYYTNGLLKAVQ